MDSVFPAAPAVPGVILLQIDQRSQLRPELAEHIRILPQNIPDLAPHQQLAQLHIDSLRRHMLQHVAVFMDGLGGLFLDLIPEHRPKP